MLSSDPQPLSQKTESYSWPPPKSYKGSGPDSKTAEKASQMMTLGLPWWLSGKESTCRCRRHGFNPWSRKIPHAVGQLILSATTAEPVLYGARELQLPSPRAATTEARVPYSLSSTTREATALRSPHTATRE